jgi:hypothetical protein
MLPPPSPENDTGRLPHSSGEDGPEKNFRAGGGGGTSAGRGYRAESEPFGAEVGVLL